MEAPCSLASRVFSLARNIFVRYFSVANPQAHIPEPLLLSPATQQSIKYFPVVSAMCAKNLFTKACSNRARERFPFFLLYTCAPQEHPRVSPFLKVGRCQLLIVGHHCVGRFLFPVVAHTYLWHRTFLQKNKHTVGGYLAF